jgi:hypothetical protein
MATKKPVVKPKAKPAVKPVMPMGKGMMAKGGKGGKAC